MPQKLTHLKIGEVSLVDNPANSELIDGKKVQRAMVALYKRDLSAALWDSEDEVCKAVDGPDEGVSKDGKTYDGVAYPKSDFAYAPSDAPSDWKLRLTKVPGGSPDAGIVGAAVAALGKGFRGKKVQVPAAALAGVKAKVRAAWKKINPGRSDDELPPVLKGDSKMTLEEIEKRVTDQDAVLASLATERDVLKAENEAVLKMNKAERELYAGMDVEKRKAFMAGDAEKRKAMFGAEDEKKKEKAAEDSMDEATKKRFREAGPIEKAAMMAEVEKKLLAKAKGGKEGEDKPGEGDKPGASDEPDEDDLEKRELVQKLAATEDRIHKTEVEIAAIRKVNRTMEFAKRAEAELPNTPGTPLEKGEMLMTLADSLPGGEKGESFKKVFEGMKGADAAYKGQFTEIGKHGGGGSGTALGAFDAKVEEIAKRDKIDTPHAIEKALKESPDLYLEYEKDQRQMVGRY